MSKIFTAFFSILILCGCAGINGKLSESEKLTIVDMARYTITKQNRRFVTAQEAAEINKKMPEIRIRYTGPRQGKMWISWSMENKTVNFTYSGEFLTDSAMWQMGIAKHDYRVSKEKVDPFHKRPPASADDFADLRDDDKNNVKKPR